MKHVIHNLEKIPTEYRWYAWQQLIDLTKKSDFPKFIGKRKVSFWELKTQNHGIIHISIEKMKTQYTYRLGYEKFKSNN